MIIYFKSLFFLSDFTWFINTFFLFAAPFFSKSCLILPENCDCFSKNYSVICNWSFRSQMIILFMFTVPASHLLIQSVCFLFLCFYLFTFTKNPPRTRNSFFSTVENTSLRSLHQAPFMQSIWRLLYCQWISWVFWFVEFGLTEHFLFKMTETATFIFYGQKGGLVINFHSDIMMLKIKLSAIW